MQEQAVPCQNSHTGSELVVSLRSQAALRYPLMRPWTTWVRLIRAVASTSWARARTAEVVVPAIRGCASIMDSVFGDRDADGQADATGSQ